MVGTQNEQWEIAGFWLMLPEVEGSSGASAGDPMHPRQVSEIASRLRCPTGALCQARALELRRRRTSWSTTSPAVNTAPIPGELRMRPSHNGARSAQGGSRKQQVAL